MVWSSLSTRRPTSGQPSIVLYFVVVPLVCLSIQSLFAQGQPEVVVELDRERIYEGESVRYSVLLNHMADPEPPKLDGFDDFDVQFLGSSSQQYSFNGQLIRNGQLFQYRLTPRRSGHLTIPAPVAQAGGTQLHGRSLTLEVRAPEDQDVALLEISADRNRVYPLQTFTVTLTVAVKALPEPYAERNPVVAAAASLRRLPALSIPWANDEGLPGGLQPEVSRDQWLNPLIEDGGYGFSINNFTGGVSVFSLFDDRLLAFLPKRRRSVRSNQKDQPIDYWQFDFVRRFTPQSVGQYMFGPVTLKGQLIDDIRDRDAADVQDVYAIARPIRVTVQDVPVQGRPESYIHAIGQFSIDSHLVPQTAKVGDRVTLTLSLRGRGKLDTAVPPDLNRVPGIPEQFGVYEPTEETRDNEKLFTYSLRLLNPGEITLPSIPVTYFDVEKEQYVTVGTDPIPIEVAVAKMLTDRDIAIARPFGTSGENIELSEDGILANMEGLSALRNQSVDAPRWFLFLAGIGGLYVVVVLVSGRVQQWVGDERLLRRRAAPRRARSRLQKALAEINDHQLREAADHLRATLTGLVADIAGIDEAGLTSADAQQTLLDMGVHHDLVQRLSRLLEACDGARYGASESALYGLGEQAESLLNELLKTLKAGRLL